MPRIKQPETQFIVGDVLLGVWLTGKPVIAANRKFVPVGLLHPDRTTETGLRFERRADAVEAAFQS
jgi:hypothetical protein